MQEGLKKATVGVLSWTCRTLREMTEQTDWWEECHLKWLVVSRTIWSGREELTQTQPAGTKPRISHHRSSRLEERGVERECTQRFSKDDITKGSLSVGRTSSWSGLNATLLGKLRDVIPPGGGAYNYYVLFRANRIDTIFLSELNWTVKLHTRSLMS